VERVARWMAAMDEGMCLYHLRPRDALHLAAMQKCDCFDLVSHDPDFDRVPEVRRYKL
jgi:predicted nucleic acid-binding protein